MAPDLTFDTDAEAGDADELNPAGLDPGTFVVSHTEKGKCRTLHCVGRCFRKPGVHYAHFEVQDAAETLEAVNIDLYERVCKCCYPPAAAASGSADTSSEESSSGSDSSDSDDL